MAKANPWFAHRFLCYPNSFSPPSRVWKSFTNSARGDGLQLNHWERKADHSDELNYRFSKFNVSVEVAEYTDGEYEVIKDADWSREESDYLLHLCREYDLRFPVIWDRYEFPNGKPRSMEDIKARYYFICRTLMELRTPHSKMTPAQAYTFELMKFDKEQEVARKRMAERQFSRTPEQCHEEEMLLAELKRIVSVQDKMAEDRRDLFQRLSFPQTTGTISAYTGSQGLAHLRDMMVSNSDKNKKRKSIAMATQPAETPQTSSTTTNDRTSTGPVAQREGQANKRNLRRLSDEEEKVYGVSRHDRLSSGVKLRSAMITANPKGVSAQKVAQALQQLSIASRLTMPTTKTVRKYEELQSSVGALLDAKKLLDKVEQELRVLKAQQEQRRSAS
jgi:DNA methyltransferase 1-associated protein 1